MPYVVFKGDKSYVRIVPNASVPELADNQGKPLEGVYEQAYLLKDVKDD